LLLINGQISGNIKKSIHELIFRVNIKQHITILFLYLKLLLGVITAFGESNCSTYRI